VFWPVSKLQFFLSPNMIVCFKKKNVCSVKPQRRRSRDGQNSFLNGNRFFVFKRKKTIFFSFSFLNVKEFISFFFKTIFSNVIRFEKFKTIKKKVCLGKNVSFKSKTISKMDSQKGKRSFCKKNRKRCPWGRTEKQQFIYSSRIRPV